MPQLDNVGTVAVFQYATTEGSHKQTEKIHLTHIAAPEKEILNIPS